MKNRVLSWMFAVVVLMSCAACGGHKSSTASPAGLRLVNVTQAGNLSLRATDSSSNSSTTSTVGVAAGSSYLSLTAGTYSVVVSSADGTLTASATTSVSLSAGVNYTVVAYQRGGVIKLQTITDSQTAAASGFAAVTAVNAATDAGTVDIYVVPPGSALTNLSPVFSSINAGGSSLSQSISAGTYDIVVTAYNKPTDIRLTIPSVSLTTSEIVSLVLTGTTGGTLVDGALIQQGGTVQLQRANTARVRVVAAFPANGSSNSSIATYVGGSALGTITSPSIGTYVLVAAGTTSYTVSVDGVAVSSLPATTFASGGDYTILVYGTASTSPSVAVLADNNQLPSSGAKIRLVNAAVSTGGLSLSDNYLPLFAEITYGTASDYSGVSSGTSFLQLTSPVAAFTSYTPTVSLLSGGVYSLFVLGTTSAASEVLSKDK